MSYIHFLLLCLVGLLAVLPCMSQVPLPPFQKASTSGPPFQGRRNLAATTFYGRTYIYGGLETNADVALSDLWVSSDDGGSWTNNANPGLPARYDGALVTVQTVVNNTQLLLFIGGNAGSSLHNDVYFSVDGRIFAQGTNAPFSPRSAFATAIALPVQDQSGSPLLNGLPALFVLGGFTGAVVNDVYYTSGRGIFNFVLATSAAPWPARVFHQAIPVESGTRIVVLGGQTLSGVVLNDVWLSAVGGISWRQLLAAAPWGPRAGFGLVNIGEKLFVFGGNGSPVYNDSRRDISLTQHSHFGGENC